MGEEEFKRQLAYSAAMVIISAKKHCTTVKKILSIACWNLRPVKLKP